VLWIAGSAVGVLSGKERGWEVAGCIMVMPERWVVGSAMVRECEGPKVQSLSTDRCRVRLPGWQELEHRQVRDPEQEHR
jgi:hypothetical protein